MSSAGARLMAATVLMLICATGCATEVASSSAAISGPVPSGTVSSGAGSSGTVSTGPARSSRRPTSAPATDGRAAAPPTSPDDPVSADRSPTGTPGPTATPRTRPAVPSSPDLYPQADGALAPKQTQAGQVALASAGGRTRDGKPYLPVVFTASNLWLAPTGAATAFVLQVDAGMTIGAATQVRVSYDLTGDGSWDRVETYRYFATDPKSGPERYTQDAGLRSTEGKPGELRGGVVRLEVWSALGGGGTVIDLPGSSLTLPYR